MQKVNIEKFGVIQLYFNKGSVRLEGYLDVEMKTEIPYDAKIEYFLILQNIEYTHYKYQDREYRKHKVLVELEEKGISYNSQGNTIIRAKIKMPKEGRITKYIATEHTYKKFNRVSYYWELVIRAKVPSSISLKRTFEIEVIEKIGVVSREINENKRRRKK